MARHRKYELLEIVAQSINDSGWNVIFVGGITDHPFLLKIYKDQESFLVRIYIWNLTHGGGLSRPKDEYRVQFTSVERFVQEQDEKTLILGYWKEAGVFAGFDYNEYKGKIYQPRGSDSSQIKEDNLIKASLNGFSPYETRKDAVAVAFRPDFFVTYVQNLEQLHAFGTSRRDFRVLEEISNKPLELNTTIIETTSKQRQTALFALVKKLRDASFKARVLTAYSNRCAFSGIQLKLVDAAHILPVSHEKSTDETSNGIALSALYHRAFDRGLVTVNDNYRIIINKSAMRHFKEVYLDGGMDKFLKDLRPIIHFPPSVSDRPNINFIREANKLRRWNL